MIQNRKLWVLLGTPAQAGYLSVCKHLSSSVQMLCSGSGSWLTWGTARPDGTSCASRPGMLVPVLAGAAWYLLCSKSSTVGTASVVLSITPKDLVINLLVDEESLVVNVVGEVEDQLDEEYLVVNVLGEVEVEVPSRQCSSVSSQFEFEYDFNLIWVPNLKLNMILIWFEIPIWSWIWFQFDLSSQLEVEYYFNLIEFEHDPTWLNLNDKFFSPSPRWFSSDYSHFAT